MLIISAREILFWRVLWNVYTQINVMKRSHRYAAQTFQLPVWFPCSDLSRGSHTSKSRWWSAHQEVKNPATLALTFLSQDGLEVIERGKSLSQQWKGLFRMLCHFPSVASLPTFCASVFIKVLIISSTTCILARCFINDK